MSSSDGYYIKILNNAIVYIYRYGNPIVYILGNIGNLLSAVVFMRKAWKKNVCVFYFLISLVLSSIYLNSTILGTALINGFNINAQNSSVILCKLLFYAAFLSSTLLPTVLILASIDRLLISSQNVETRLHSSKRLAYFSISVSTFFWIIFNIHVLIKVNLQEIVPSQYVCYYDQSNFYVDFVSYFLMIFNTLVCLAIIILSVIAFKNIRHIRIFPHHQRNQIRSMTIKDFQLLRCLFVQDIVYITVSIFSSVFSIYTATTRNQRTTSLQQAIHDFLDNFFVFLYFIFYCVNFFIFLIISKVFRHELKRMIYKIFGKNLREIRDEDNKQETMKDDHRQSNIVVVNSISNASIINK
ncbi:unnamed protein product [Rotaria sp. Silwood2]|nr:unnamed protein product [Rotaria sp. Silwood2]CAF3039832.1 unnamed protein product [Rotaria sp. Silwood2]CAF3371103.1 unnamed protein product [Rotaria sp. Silwood2]CAF4229109.1 unnamed protein product [Rotaria sp. Silwood2]CAF4259457.1 unnamed protein product [Rotaria sp. Silwood2]